jgi:hypothetical protein
LFSNSQIIVKSSIHNTIPPFIAVSFFSYKRRQSVVNYATPAAKRRKEMAVYNKGLPLHYLMKNAAKGLAFAAQLFYSSF